tara:strand:- start:3280 stop:3783 length:504 start_codon:yes stop_codon:yes gene_type:complete
MPNVNHSALTGTSLHEPKGAAAASNHTTYVSNGSGSGSWQKVDADSINTASIKNSNLTAFTYKFKDVSTATSQWVSSPLAGKIKTIYTALGGALGTADAVISFEIAGTLVTSGTVTITQSGSAAGDLDSSTPSGANTVTAGQVIEVISNGASTNTVDATITFVLDVA